MYYCEIMSFFIKSKVSALFIIICVQYVITIRKGLYIEIISQKNDF